MLKLFIKERNLKLLKRETTHEMMWIKTIISSLPLLLLACVVAEDFQAWSEISYLDVDHELTCNDTKGKVFIHDGVLLKWSKQNHPGYLETDDHYELKHLNGIANMSLVVKNVTSSKAGVYFCNVFNSTGEHIGRVVKGLNLAGPLYDDYINEYRWNIVVGFVAAGCVMFLIIGVSLVENFRYRTEEQKQKIKDRKNGINLKIKHGGDHGKGVVNDAAELSSEDDTDTPRISTNSDKVKEPSNGLNPYGHDLANTHL